MELNVELTLNVLLMNVFLTLVVLLLVNPICVMACFVGLTHLV